MATCSWKTVERNAQHTHPVGQAVLLDCACQVLDRLCQIVVAFPYLHQKMFRVEYKTP